jgi:glycerol-3-phosphate acyltransferase PlsY
MIIESILLVVGAYLLGSVPSAYLVAKWTRGVDIRRYGSGNVGATNLLKITSKWLAILVIIFDLGKGAVVVWIAQLVGLSVAPQVIVGVAAIIGHNWPVFLGFNGGRGVLTLVGVGLVLMPLPSLILVFIAFIFAPFHQLALGAILSIAGLSVFAWFLAQPFGIEEPLTLSLGFLAIFLITVLRRLTAPRTSLSESISMGELVVNRLLFDRDIRSREAWISRVPPEMESAEPPFKQQEKQVKS